ncbi:MAG: ATP-binding protein [Verrucomicrobia bacterium]|nr:MAG: ATP-binding protein [Verrucomicrobiota bacterium]
MNAASFIKPLRIQGLAFSVLAIASAIFAEVWGGSFSDQSGLILLATLILLLGVPHGALDTIFAYKLYDLRKLADWILFTLIYLLLAALVVAIWWWAPMVFLILFLLISAAHFSGDPEQGTPLLTRILYGGSILVLPALLHSGEMGRLFGFLVGTNPAASLMPWITLLAWIWLPCAVLSVILLAWSNGLGALEIGAVLVLSVVAPPLLAFTLFFCGMHSARHILRTIDYSGNFSRSLLAISAFLPMIGVLVISVGAWEFLKEKSLDERIVQIVFVGLAALTVPHMALVERVRLSGWIKGGAKLSGTENNPN